MKLNSCLEIEWSKVFFTNYIYQDTNFIWGTSFTHLIDDNAGNYYIASINEDLSKYSPDSSNGTFYVYKIDYNGNFIWSKKIINSFHGTAAPQDFLLVNDKLLFSGDIYVPIPTQHNSVVYRRSMIGLIDSSGSLLLYKCYNDSIHEYGSISPSIPFSNTSIGAFNYSITYNGKNSSDIIDKISFDGSLNEMKKSRQIYFDTMEFSPTQAYTDFNDTEKVMVCFDGFITSVGNQDSIPKKYYLYLIDSNMEFSRVSVIQPLNHSSKDTTHQIQQILKTSDGKYILSCIEFIKGNTGSYMNLIRYNSNLQLDTFTDDGINKYNSLCSKGITTGVTQMVFNDTIVIKKIIPAKYYTSVNSIDFNQIKFEIYPNPSSEMVNISCSEKPIRFMIFDEMGREIKTGKFDDSSNSFNVYTLQNGIYILRIEFNNGQSSHKNLLINR